MNPKNFHNLCGSKVGRLSIVSRADNGPNWATRWNCLCDCGTSLVVTGGRLASGKTKSCGCLRKEITASTFTTHGLRKSKEYAVWNTLIQRCTNPNHENYDEYKSRVPPERWFKFENFYADMGPRPGPGYSIERVKNELGYCPGNCIWATSTTQNRNRKDTKMIEYNGQIHPLPKWAEILGKRYGLLSLRLHRGWSVERAFTS